MTYATTLGPPSCARREREGGCEEQRVGPVLFWSVTELCHLVLVLAKLIINLLKASLSSYQL